MEGSRAGKEGRWERGGELAYPNVKLKPPMIMSKYLYRYVHWTSNGQTKLKVLE